MTEEDVEMPTRQVGRSIGHGGVEAEQREVVPALGRPQMPSSVNRTEWA